MKWQIKRINRVLITGWGIIALILFAMYAMEVTRGNRSVAYLVVFTAVTAIPPVILSVMYRLKPDNKMLQYWIVGGYMLMYAFVLFTSRTPVVYTYILPLLSLLILYHNPTIIRICAIVTIILNALQIARRYSSGEITDLLDRDIRIQVLMMGVCLVAFYFSAVIYDSIYQNNLRYVEEIDTQKNAMRDQSVRLEELNRELNEQKEELMEMNEQLREMTMQTIMTIANTIDEKDEYTRGHSRRVAEYSVAIARELGMTGEQIRDVRFAGLLHDIGKIGVPDNVINKPGKLTSEEFQIMKDHTITGGEILKDITIMRELDICARYHHEKYDGTGYPEGLAGNKIPLIARIVGVADAYDAMTSNRVYRRHLDQKRVMEELEKGNGKQFDPEICSALIRLVEAKRLPRLNIDDDSIEIRQTTQILTRVIDKAEEKAVEDIHFDELTGTLSREGGIREIQNRIRQVGRGTVFVFDLDDFRKVNEKEGFASGDRYLAFVAGKIKDITPGTIVARFGADEFLAYVPEVDGETEAEETARDFQREIAEAAEKNPDYSMLSVSMGITQVATEKDRVMGLYGYASKALFVAKQYGRGGFFFHRMEASDSDDGSSGNMADLEHLAGMLVKDSVAPETYSRIMSFGDFRESVRELLKESQESLNIVLFTVRCADDAELATEDINSIMDVLEDSIRHSVRSVDSILRFSSLQHALILVGTDDASIQQVVNRILILFYRMNPAEGTEVRYNTVDLRSYASQFAAEGAA